MNGTNDEIEIDLRELFGVFLHHIGMIFAVTVLGGLIMGLVSVYLLTPQYTSTSKIYILTSTSSMLSLSDLQMGSNLANDYEELIKSRPVVETVAENLSLDMGYEQLLGCITISNKDNTRIIQITATSSDPVVAMQIANEFAEVSKEQISEIMQVDKPTTVETAVVAEHKSSPNNQKNVAIGGMLGFVLSAAFVILRYMLDDTVKTAEDVERYLGLNTLAAVPDEGGTDNTEKHEKKRFRGIRKG